MSNQNLRVVSFEARMELPLKRLLEKQGMTVITAPALKEIPLNDNTQAFTFYESLKAGKIDYLILMTGVATRTLIATLETKFSKEEIINNLSTKTKIVVRGPKPRSVCSLNNIPMTHIVPEPNTWKEILATLDTEAVIAKKNVVVLEYGITNDDFIDALIERQAKVDTLRVYAWALPDDLAPLNKAIDEIMSDRTDFLAFTTQVQVEHLLQIVRERKCELAFRRALHRIGIASIGPVTTEKLADVQFFADIEASPPKNDALVKIISEKGLEVLEKKRSRADMAQVWVDYPNLILPSHERRTTDDERRNSPFLRACRKQPNKQIPIWLMRQAGRYMAEYHLSRHGLEFLDFCKNSDRAAEATLTAIERLNVDAAIIFADILLILEPMGLKLDYIKGQGPTIYNPIRTIDDIQNLKTVDVKQSLDYVMTAIKKVRSHMRTDIPLLGFCGAPYTMASYMIAGGSPSESDLTQKFMKENTLAWNELMEKITTASIDYLNAQIEAGADALQIFDSWVGKLTPVDYKQYVLSHSKRLIDGINKKVPLIHFGTQTKNLLGLMKEAGGDVIGIDAHTDIKEAWDNLGDVAVQGNLDSNILFKDQKTILQEAQKILEAVGSKPGFIFNLGHGILQGTPVDNVMALVDFVKNWKI